MLAGKPGPVRVLPKARHCSMSCPMPGWLRLSTSEHCLMARRRACWTRWQQVPSIWNQVRRACDDRAQMGQFILTGSAHPPDETTRHSGAGRLDRVRMRPMSLFESGESDGRRVAWGTAERRVLPGAEFGYSVPRYRRRGLSGRLAEVGDESCRFGAEVFAQLPRRHQQD